jgi:hypothetical protein
LAGSRSSESFLHAAQTKAFIEEIANSSSLVIFAGAGISIDRTGLTWAKLLEELLDEVGLGKDELAGMKQSTASLNPLQHASVVRSVYVSKGEDWRRYLSAALRKSLYTRFYWRGGRYTDSIARLARNLIETDRSVAVVTTNYELFIERAFQDATLSSKTDSVRAITKSLELGEANADEETPETVELGDASPIGGKEVSVIHVHGVVSDVDRPDRKAGSVVLGEIDYYQSESKVAELLIELFQNSNVLVLGSGLDDPPLLRALSGTLKKAEEKGLKRWVLLSKSGLLRDKEINELNFETRTLALEKRLEQFGLVGIYPDFYAQAHQFVREVAQEVTNSTKAITYSSSDAGYTYGKRLLSWWVAWYSSLSDQRPEGTTAQEQRTVTQHQHHAMLLSRLPEVRRALECTGLENLKLELWVRWQPDQSRRIALWASSSGTWADEKTMRYAEVSATSNLAAMRSLTSGGVEITEVENSDRWLKYVAAPVELRNDDNEKSVIVGVVTVATDYKKSKLSETNAIPMGKLAKLLPEIGARILLAEHRDN